MSFVDKFLRIGQRKDVAQAHNDVEEADNELLKVKEEVPLGEVISFFGTQRLENVERVLEATIANINKEK